MRQVGHVCWRWNHDLHGTKLLLNVCCEMSGEKWDLRQLTWKMWLQGSFLQLLAIVSRQMMQMSFAANSSSVAFGYRLFMLRMARRDRMTSLSAFLNVLRTHDTVHNRCNGENTLVTPT